MTAYQVTPSRIFVFSSLAFLFGIATTTLSGEYSFWITLSALSVGGFGVFAPWPRGAPFGSRRYFLFGCAIALVAFGLGTLRTESELQRVNSAREKFARVEEYDLMGIITEHPKTDLEKTSIVVRDDALGEKIQVRTHRDVTLRKSDIVHASGRIQLPESFNGFNYPMFLAKDGIVTVMRADDVTRVGGAGPLTLGHIRALIDNTSTDVLPYTEGALLKALLLGDEGSMTEVFKRQLNDSGLRHLVAISGMNIAIILGLLTAVTMRLGWSRKLASISGLVCVVVFVLLIGAPASAVRAGIMGLLLVLAPLLGRRGSGIRAAVAALTLMVAISPLSLVYDVGLQLSFAAVIGIMFFSKTIQSWFWWAPALIAETLAMTFAAQIAVTPILLTSFGQVSLVAPMSNLLVVPLIAPMMLWGVCAVFLGMLWLPLGQIIAAPLLPYFSFVRFVAERLSELPFAVYASFAPTGAIFAVVWYGALGFIAYRFKQKTIRPIDEVV